MIYEDWFTLLKLFRHSMLPLLLWTNSVSILAPIRCNAIIVLTALIHLHLMTYLFSLEVSIGNSGCIVSIWSQGWLRQSIAESLALKNQCFVEKTVNIISFYNKNSDFYDKNITTLIWKWICVKHYFDFIHWIFSLRLTDFFVKHAFRYHITLDIELWQNSIFYIAIFQV